MFKKIPGNLDYLINLRNEIIDSYGSIIDFKINNQKTTIDLFGVSKKININYLSLLAWYEVGVINNLKEHINKINFLVVNEKLSIRCKRIMMFTEPIYFKDGFRYIPNYPRYAINTNGDVIDTLSNSIVTNRRSTNDGYEIIYLYSPDRCMNRNIRIHRLLALAWIPNNDFVNRPFINHIDGVRNNNKLENLEWCSEVENAQHAISTGLVPTLVKMKTRDVTTGEIVVYNSASEMAKKLGTTRVSATGYVSKLPGYLYNKRYEIKLFSDTSPWYYEDNEYDPSSGGKSIFTISVLDKTTGIVSRFINVHAFYKKYKIWTKSTSIEEGIVAFREKYPNHEISYKRNSVSKPYRILDLETNQMVICDTLIDVGNVINRSRTEIQYDLSRGLKFIYSNKWIVVPGLSEIVLTDYKHKQKPFNKVLIVDVNNHSDILANSIKHAARITKMDPKTITRHIDSENVIKGFIFRALG